MHLGIPQGVTLVSLMWTLFFIPSIFPLFPSFLGSSMAESPNASSSPGLVMGRRWWAGPGLGLAGPAGSGRPINFWYDGPRPGPGHQILIWWATARPGPAHQIFRGWAAARLSPSHFQKFAARPGPSFFHKSRPGPSHDSAAHETRTLYGPAQQLRGPARGFDGPDHVLSRTKMCMRIR